MLTIAPTTWSNTGTLLASGTGTLNLGGTFTTPSLAGLNGAGGNVVITSGTLDNTGQTFTVTTTTGNVQLGQGGRILNGTVSNGPGAQLVLPSGVTGTLDGVTLNTDLTHTEQLDADGEQRSDAGQGSQGHDRSTGEQLGAVVPGAVADPRWDR